MLILALLSSIKAACNVGAIIAAESMDKASSFTLLLGILSTLVIVDVLPFRSKAKRPEFATTLHTVAKRNSTSGYPALLRGTLPSR